MGTFTYPVAVTSSTGERFVEVEAIVDSGATYSWLPRPILQQAGVVPAFQREFVLADGRIIVREMAVVRMRVDGQILPTPCIFGDEGTQPLLGAVTLEEFGLGVDPVNKRLIPVRGFLLAELINWRDEHTRHCAQRVLRALLSQRTGTLGDE